MRVAINGFGRIGRVFMRAALTRKDSGIKVVAVNHGPGVENAAYLFKYDSIYGKYPGEISVGKNSFTVDGHVVRVVSDRDPGRLPWKKLKVDVVMESTGVFTEQGASKHLKAGAKRVIITAPSKSCGTFVPGVNMEKLDKKEKIINMGSCTTNCLAPVIKILNDEFGIDRVFYNTIHAYTNDQRLHDSFHERTRRGRAAAINMVPTSSGASVSVVRAIPEMKGKIDGLALRVPVVNGSIIDVVAELKKPFSVAKVNSAFKKYSKEKMKGMLEYSDEELVSTDIIGNSHSCVFDSLLTKKDGNLIKVLAWYDNEYGYCNRLVDLLEILKDGNAV